MSEIILSNVGVEYPIYNARQKSFRHTLMKAGAGALIRSQEQGFMSVSALNGASLCLSNGDRIGLIGKNGSGKSTLLSVLAGICMPTSGSVQISGKTHSLFSVAGGMDEELTGYENIHLLGMLNDIDPGQITELIPDIENFTELGHFLNFPVRTYSAGMKMRLAFAVATSVSPDILLLDEAIGAGDASFVRKATDRAQDLYDRTNILVMASHSTEIIRSLCNRCVLMDAGRIICDGENDEVIKLYESGDYLPKSETASNSLNKSESIENSLTVITLVDDSIGHIKQMVNFFSNRKKPIKRVIFVNAGYSDLLDDEIHDFDLDDKLFSYVNLGSKANFAEALNKILAEVTTEYVMFSCTKDKYADGFFAENVRCLKRYPEAALSCSKAIISSDEYNGGREVRSFSPAKSECYLSKQTCRSIYLKNGRWIIDNTIVFNTDILRLEGAFEISLEGFSLDFKALELSCKYGCVYLPLELSSRASRPDIRLESIYSNPKKFLKVTREFEASMKNLFPSSNNQVIKRSSDRWHFDYKLWRAQAHLIEISKPRDPARGWNYILNLSSAAHLYYLCAFNLSLWVCYLRFKSAVVSDLFKKDQV